MLKICRKCGNKFETKARHQVYCSVQCGLTFYKSNAKNAKLNRCVVCGQLFEPNFKTEKFCSDSCRVAFWKL